MGMTHLKVWIHIPNINITNTLPPNGSEALLLDKQHSERQEAAHMSLHGLYLVFKGLDTNEYTRK